MMAEVEETLKRIQSHKGVMGTMVVNAEGSGAARAHCSVWNEARSWHAHQVHPPPKTGYVWGFRKGTKQELNKYLSIDFFQVVCNGYENLPELPQCALIIQKGIPIRTTLDNSTTVQYAGLLHQLTMKAKSTVRDIDPQNDLTFLRIRSKKHEIMVAPDKEYLLIVIQNPCE